jgi:hypothetical protein
VTRIELTEVIEKLQHEDGHALGLRRSLGSVYYEMANRVLTPCWKSPALPRRADPDREGTRGAIETSQRLFSKSQADV